MNYLSTRGGTKPAGFEHVLLAGLAEDGGLYLPARWPRISHAAQARFAQNTYEQNAAEIMRPFAARSPLAKTLPGLTARAFAAFSHQLRAPLVQTGSNEFILELFHGPTLAFKDFAMQLLAPMLNHALRRNKTRMIILGATSGDTGGAAIHAFANAPRASLFILYPDNRISPVQRRQMTTPAAKNVHALAVDGTFDDCQAIVKHIFANPHTAPRARLGAVNSINWARIMAQIVYYFTAAAALGGGHGRRIRFVVPTGNFGNIFAGYAAMQMGAPIEKLVIAANDNDVLVRTLETGVCQPRKTRQTLSPAMDIQAPSNFERLVFEACRREPKHCRSLFADLRDRGRFTLPPAALRFIKERFAAVSVSRAQTKRIMAELFRQNGRLIDPHTAVGLAAARRLPSAAPVIVLAPAHPAKFPEAVRQATGQTPPPPPALAALARARERRPRAAPTPQAVLRFIGKKSVTGLLTHKLANGLTLLCAPRPHVETFAAALWVHSGARGENPAEHGVSHLLEHMAFKGTETRSPRDIAEQIENAGGYINAATGHETTSYAVRLLAEDLPLGVELLADILQKPAFDGGELEKERRVIQQEIAQSEDTPDDHIFDLLMEAAYPGQALGRPILGTRKSVAGFTPADLRRHIAGHYRAGGMVFAAAGKLDPDRMAQLAESHFAHFPAGRPPGFPPAQFRSGELRRPKKIEQTHIALAFEGAPAAHPDFFTAQIFSFILGGGMSSRLFQEIREKRGLCYAVSSFCWSFADTGLAGFYAACAPDSLPELLPAAAEILADMTRSITKEEIARARAQAKTGLLMSLESSSARSDQIAQHYLTYGEVPDIRSLIAKIEAVDADALHNFARKLLARQRPALAAVGPLGKLENYDSLAARFR